MASGTTTRTIWRTAGRWGAKLRVPTYVAGAAVADNVNHPAHYTAYQGIEVIQLTEQMNFNRGNAVKYIARAGLKDPDKEVEDLRKAVWYLEREIARIENG